jgi:predicted HTH transcriptional regulator
VSPREVTELEARLFDVLTSTPGLTRSELAAQLGIERERLHRPLTNLLHGRRIVREGHKEKTSYRPVDAGCQR